MATSVRRRGAFLGALGCLVFLVLLSGNGYASSSSRAITRGGALTIGAVGLSWISLDPANPQDQPKWYVGNPIFDSLFVVKNNHVVPQLATKYRYADGGRRLLLYIRKGVKFQDNTPLNAQAVLFNFKRYNNPKLHTECLPDFAPVTSMKALNQYTVELSFSIPYSPMIWDLATTPCSMMASPTAVKSEGANFGEHPVGAGPFKFVSEVTNSTVKLEAWAGYWQKGRPYLNSLTIISEPNATAALDALKAGNVQLVMAGGAPLPPQVVGAAKADSSLTTYKLGAPEAKLIWFNTTKPPFNTLAARKAIIEATDPSSLIKNLYSGYAVSTQSILGPGSWAFPGARVPGYPSYNLANAQKLVKSIGGLSFTLDVLNIPTGPESVQEGEALKAQWAKAGIDATLDPVDIVTLIGDAHAKTFQALALGTSGTIEPDIPLYSGNYSSSPLNFSGVHSKALDRALLQGRERFTRAGRKAAYRKVFGILAQLLPYDYLYAPTYYDLGAKTVHGFHPNASQWIELQNVWLGG